jgi:tRNA-dihydrouridine synthase B
MVKRINTKSNIFLAPMAGVNDVAFRILCHKYGAGITYSEMINVNAIQRRNKATIRMAYNPVEEQPYCVQLFGTRLDAIRDSIKYLEKKDDNINVNMFDFNFGCPVRKVMNIGAGSALLKRPSKIGEIISVMRDSTDLPVTGKIRLGITKNGADYVKTAKIIENAGADAIAVHARYQDQGYSGKADWNAIKEIVENIDIPVIANGDVVDEKTCIEIFEKTKCKYLMIGRASLGNPFIFSRLNSILESGNSINQENKIKLFLEYLDLANKFQVKTSFIKQHAIYFTKGINSSALLRQEMSKLKDIDAIKNLFINYMKDS